MKTIGIIGSRRRDSEQDYNKAKDALMRLYEKGDRICSGLCSQGGDRFAVTLALELGAETLWFPADWKQFGKAAGFIRNTDIAKNSDILIACVAEDRKGGTEDTIKKFKKFHPNNTIIII